MTPQALRLLVEAGLSAIDVDVKGDAGTVRAGAARRYDGLSFVRH